MADEKEQANISRRRFLRFSSAGAAGVGAAVAGAHALGIFGGTNGAPASGPQGGVTRAAVIDALKNVRDPEIPINIYDLGLVYNIDVNEESGKVGVRMTLTTPYCPANAYIPEDVRRKVGQVPGVKETDVQICWDPPWTPEMMSETAKKQFEWGIWNPHPQTP